MAKLILAQTSATLSPIPLDTTNTTMGEWMDSNNAVLGAAPRYIDGVSIVNMKWVDLVDDLKHYRV